MHISELTYFNCIKVFQKVYHIVILYTFATTKFTNLNNKFIMIQTVIKPVSYTHLDVYKRQFMNCLELLVACLQAYIFTLLSANYIGLAKVKD